MRKIESYLKNRNLNFEKTLKYGFIKKDNVYTYEKFILDNEFKVIITISSDEITSKVIEVSVDDEYLMADVENAVGEFVGKVKSEYEKTIIEVIDGITDISIFNSEQSKLVIDYIKEKYGDELEFLWSKYPDNAIWRNKISEKWYAVLMNINEDKLGIDGNKTVTIIDLMYQKGESTKVIDKEHIFPGYHMNKDSWITIRLDGSVEIDKIYKLIDNSYNLSDTPHNWVIPANTTSFDVIGYFENNDTVIWHQNIKAHIGDIAYIYIGVPYSAIMFKCTIIKVKIEESNRYYMELKLIEKYDKDKYPLSTLKKNGLLNVRSERAVPLKTLEYLNK